MTENQPDIEKLVEMARTINESNNGQELLQSIQRMAQDKQQQAPLSQHPPPVPQSVPQPQQVVQEVKQQRSVKDMIIETLPNFLQDPVIIFCLFILVSYPLTKNFIGKYSPTFSDESLTGNAYRATVLVVLFISLRLIINYMKKN